jgi:hypothetical protein
VLSNANAKIDISYIPVDELNLAQEQDIIALQASITALRGGFYVGDFTPGGEPVTDLNFEAAFRAALAAAAAACGIPENGGDQRGGACVYVPPGTWPMANGIFINADFPRYAPSIIGMGSAGSVALEFSREADFPGISIGYYANGERHNTLTNSVVLQNLRIQFPGGANPRGGIRARSTWRLTMRDVIVRGVAQNAYSLTDTPWHEAVGFDFRDNNVGEVLAPDFDKNHQHLYLERCNAMYCTIGIWFGTAVWSVTAIDCDPNGCVYPVLYEAAVVGWFGGNVQGGLSSSSRHRSGAMYTTGLPSGSGASITAVADGKSTVTGLAAMLGYRGSPSAVTYKDSWIVLNQHIYIIADVLGPTSCTVYRDVGYAHDDGAARTDLTYEVRGCSGGNNVILTGGIYQEGSSRYYLHLGADLYTNSQWVIESVQTKVTDAVVCATGCSGTINVRSVREQGSLKHAVLNQVCSFVTDQGTIDKIDTDDYSRSGIIARAPALFAGMQSHVWDARPRSMRYNSALLERGAIVFDARKTNTIVRTGTDITSWTDLAGLSTLTRITPENAPQFIAMDAGMGAPAVQLLGAPNAGLSCDIGSRFPAGSCMPTLMVVARISEAVQSVGTRRIVLDAPGHLQAYIGFDDSSHSSSRDLYAYYWTDVTAGTAPDLVESDTNAHWLFTGIVSGRESLGAGSDALAYRAIASHHGAFRVGPTFPLSLVLSLFTAYGYSPGDIIVSHVAVLPRGITDAEREHYRDLAINEFNIEGQSASVSESVAFVEDSFTTLATSSDGEPVSASALSQTPSQSSIPRIYLNGVLIQNLKYGDKTGSAYFSNTNGSTAATRNALTAGTVLYWNASVAGFQLQSGWSVKVVYTA